MNAYKTVRIDARRYADVDDCLAAAARDATFKVGLAGSIYDCNPRWEDEQRDAVLVDLPWFAIEDRARSVAEEFYDCMTGMARAKLRTAGKPGLADLRHAVTQWADDVDDVDAILRHVYEMAIEYAVEETR